MALIYPSSRPIRLRVWTFLQSRLSIPGPGSLDESHQLMEGVAIQTLT